MFLSWNRLSISVVSFPHKISFFFCIVICTTVRPCPNATFVLITVKHFSFYSFNNKFFKLFNLWHNIIWQNNTATPKPSEVLDKWNIWCICSLKLSNNKITHIRLLSDPIVVVDWLTIEHSKWNSVLSKWLNIILYLIWPE